MHSRSLSTVITLVCVVCGRHVALRLDADDLERHRGGVLVQDAFADENGVCRISLLRKENSSSLRLAAIATPCCAPTQSLTRKPTTRRRPQKSARKRRAKRDVQRTELHSQKPNLTHDRGDRAARAVRACAG